MKIKTIKKAIKQIQFILAILLIFSIGIMISDGLEKIFNIDISAYKTFIYSLIFFVLLVIISFLLDRKKLNLSNKKVVKNE